MPERRVAGFGISDGTDPLLTVLGYEKSTEVSEEEVSGLGDTVGTDPVIIDEKYIPQSRGRTASMNGIAHTGGGTSGDGAHDAALQTILDNADVGASMTFEFRYEDGSGWDITGFFTNFTLTGDKGEATEKWNGTFRVNDVTDVAVPA